MTYKGHNTILFRKIYLFWIRRFWRLYLQQSIRLEVKNAIRPERFVCWKASVCDDCFAYFYEQRKHSHQAGCRLYYLHRANPCRHHCFRWPTYRLWPMKTVPSLETQILVQRICLTILLWLDLPGNQSHGITVRSGVCISQLLWEASIPSIDHEWPDNTDAITDKYLNHLNFNLKFKWFKYLSVSCFEIFKTRGDSFWWKNLF